MMNPKLNGTKKNPKIDLKHLQKPRENIQRKHPMSMSSSKKPEPSC
jgi:hypothetical protein